METVLPQISRYSPRTLYRDFVLITLQAIFVPDIFLGEYIL